MAGTGIGRTSAPVSGENAGDLRRQRLKSVHRMRCVVVLAGQNKSQLAVSHKRQLRALCVVNREHLIQPLRFVLHFCGQVGHGNWLYIDHTVLPCCEIIWCFHDLPFPDVNRLNHGFRPRLCEIHMQQAILHQSFTHLDPVSQYKTSLELA